MAIVVIVAISLRMGGCHGAAWHFCHAATLGPIFIAGACAFASFIDSQKSFSRSTVFVSFDTVHHSGCNFTPQQKM